MMNDIDNTLFSNITDYNEPKLASKKRDALKHTRCCHRNRKLRFHIGPGDIGNWGTLLKKYLIENGHVAELVVGCSPPRRRDYAQYDQNLELEQKGLLAKGFTILWAMMKILFTADVAIFPAGLTFVSPLTKRFWFLFALELMLYRLFNVKIIPIFVGCDLRHYRPAEAFASKIGTENWHGCQFCSTMDSCSYKTKRNLASCFEKFADLIYLHSEGRFLFKKNHIPVRLLFDPNVTRFNFPAIPPIRIVHAPSNMGKKGADRIMNIFEKIRKKHKTAVEVKLFHEMPNSKVLEGFENAHILVNQIAFYDLGQASLEGMAAGMLVISSALRTNDEIPEFSHDCPIVFAAFDSLEDKLDWYINHPEEINKKAAEGRKYVELHHDYRNVGSEMLATICDLFN